ncbi:MAG: 16S rRNA (uracil(1498)-N(3))-methyltransferase [Ignavibacteriales bacterium]|nr:16S rRNA (uracil(1498)-N(3))-methyltransferase [Ignavibacteriales bacterium]
MNDFLSDVELYCTSHSIIDDAILIDGEEAYHITHVMRHIKGDVIHITDGHGSIYKSIIQAVDQKKINCKILSSKHYENKFCSITFCIPRLRNTDRFEFALEKCVELGITNFIVFDSTRTVAKGEKIERWQKVLLSAMKQSLRAWLPKVSYERNVNTIIKLNGTRILFDQNASQTFQQFLAANNQSLITNHFFFFGPEGGLTEDECRVMNAECRVKLTDNRLRSETAIVTAASILTTTL